MLTQSGTPGSVIDWTIFSHCIQYIDFVEIFHVSLDLSSIYFARFSGCCASFVCSCYSILESYNLFFGVKLSVRSFCMLLMIIEKKHKLTFFLSYQGDRPIKKL